MNSGTISRLLCSVLALCLSPLACDEETAPSCSGDGGDTISATDSASETATESVSETASETDTEIPMTAWDYENPTTLVWVPIDGGSFMQGTDSNYAHFYHETPAHEVTVPNFEIMKNAVTTSQYAQCVQAQVCVEPFLSVVGDNSAEDCNWLIRERDDHPVNCVDFPLAETFCSWIGGRLPTESEWEFAARSRGKDNEFPWGNEAPNCELSVIHYYEDGCGTGTTWPVCSKTMGNTEQGLCDMAGNVAEWVQDCWFDSYQGNPPRDGSAWDMPFCQCQVLRGGMYSASAARTRLRYCYPPSAGADDVGFRCARDAAANQHVVSFTEPLEYARHERVERMKHAAATQRSQGE